MRQGRMLGKLPCKSSLRTPSLLEGVPSSSAGRGMGEAKQLSGPHDKLRHDVVGRLRCYASACQHTGIHRLLPWESYYGEHAVVRPSECFAIWHINGMAQYHRSVRLGLTHYMGSVQRARSGYIVVATAGCSHARARYIRGVEQHLARRHFSKTICLSSDLRSTRSRSSSDGC